MMVIKPYICRICFLNKLNLKEIPAMNNLFRMHITSQFRMTLILREVLEIKVCKI